MSEEHSAKIQSSQDYREKLEQSNAKQQSSEIDPYGFKRKSEFDYVQYQEIMSDYMPVLARRAMRWSEIMKNGKKNGQLVGRSNQIKRFCRKGIPNEHRAQVWMDLSGAKNKMMNNPGLYHQLLTRKPTPDEENRFRQMESQIEIDLDRTFPDNIYFNGTSPDDLKQMLSSVLKAYGKHRPDIGYCQGLNYLVGILLLITKSEEKSYWLLCTLMDDIIPCYYDKSMSQTLAELGVLDELVNERIPAVGEKMKKEHKPWMVISSKWFICLFIDVLPIETALRVWDCMFCEGSKILIRTALYMVMLKEEQLKKANGLSEIKSVFDKLDHDSDMLSCHTFIGEMLKRTNPMPASKLQLLREKHLRLVQQENGIS